MCNESAMHTAEGALHNALHSSIFTATNMQAVTQPTMWFVLELNFSQEKVYDLFNTGALYRPKGGWRFHRDVDLCEARALCVCVCVCVCVFSCVGACACFVLGC